MVVLALLTCWLNKESAARRMAVFTCWVDEELVARWITAQRLDALMAWQPDGSMA